MSYLQGQWGNVVLELDEQEEKTDGGLTIPALARALVFSGVVKSAGEGRVTNEGKQYPTELRPGMHVVADRFTGYTVKFEGKSYYVVPEKNIHGYWAEERLYPEPEYSDPRIECEYLDPVYPDEEPVDLGPFPHPDFEGVQFYKNMCQGLLAAAKDRPAMEDFAVAQRYQRKFDGDLSDEELEQQLAENMAKPVIPPPQHEEPRDRYEDGLEQARANNSGAWEVIETTIALYKAEEKDPNCPEWNLFKDYAKRGWEIAHAEESETLTLVRKLRRRAR